MTTLEYNQLEREDCLTMIKHEGKMLDEVVIFGILKMQIFSLRGFYVQAVYNKNDDTLMDIKGLITDEDWNPYLETLDIKDFF